MLGVDVGGTKVAVGAVAGCEATEIVEHPTDTSGSAPLLDGIEAGVREVAERSASRLRSASGVPSQIEFASGTVLTSVNIPLAGVPLREVLGHRLGVPIYVDNDANCAGLAEAELLEARNLVMLTLGTGVGGGVVIDGRIFRGAHGLGAELGHVSIIADGPPCPGNCPNRGCLEALCSGTALEREATELGKARPDTRLGGIYAETGRVSGREAVAAAQDGDPEAEAAVRPARHLARRRDRRLRERLRARAGADRGRALTSRGAVPRPRQGGGGVARASRPLGAGDGAAGSGGADAGVIGAGLLAAHEVERDTAQITAERR